MSEFLWKVVYGETEVVCPTTKGVVYGCYIHYYLQSCLPQENAPLTDLAKNSQILLKAYDEKEPVKIQCWWKCGADCRGHNVDEWKFSEYEKYGVTVHAE